MALVELRITDLAVIADARLEFGRGLATLTGETGAGKSVCVSALRMALGGPGDPAAVRSGALMASVAAVFDEVPPAVRDICRDHGIPCDDDLMTLVREVPRRGRGRCCVNGALVAQAVLREIGEALAEVTIQGAGHRLLRAPWQRARLDAAGGAQVASLLAAMGSAHRRLQTCRAARQEAHEQAATASAARDAAARVIAELEPLRLRDGEADTLVAERNRLLHATRLRDAARGIHAALHGDEDDPGAIARLDATIDASVSLEGIDAAMDSVIEEGREAGERLRDLAVQARALAEGVDIDERRRDGVEERLALLDRVIRKYGSIVDATSALEGARREMQSADWAVRIQGCDRECADAEREAADAAERLSSARQRAAAVLERSVNDQLAALDLPQARFRVLLDRRDDVDGVLMQDGRRHCTASGVDAVEFRMAANRHDVPVPLGDGPSGGELSRLALALHAAGRGGDLDGVCLDSSATLVLDEIDAGIGGETAARVGEVLAIAACNRPILVITHRPEIAARAATHLVVRKRDTSEGTTSDVRQVVGAERVTEIARLMSGRPTAAARVRAAELLENGGATGRQSAARTMSGS